MKSANRQIHLHDLASEQLERTLNAGKPVKAEDPCAFRRGARRTLRLTPPVRPNPTSHPAHRLRLSPQLSPPVAPSRFV